MKTITSSIKLNFNNIARVDPYVILAILGEEFVSTDEDITGLLQVGEVQFGKLEGKLYKEIDTYYIQLADGRTFSLTDLR